MQKKFIIEGMTCASCVATNKNSLEDLNGVSKVSINLATKQANIEFDETKLSFENIKKEIESNGFKVSSLTPLLISELDKKEDNKLLKRFIYSLVFSIPVFVGMFGDFILGNEIFGVDIIMYIFAFFSALVVFIFGGHFHKNAFKSVLKFRFNMDSLVSLGTLIAFFYSIIAIFFNGLIVYFEVSVAIITFINLGKYLEHRAKTKAGDAIGKLLELGVKKAFVLEGKEILEKDIDNIGVGEIIIIKAGEKIALDGIIINGSANIDESMLTGESMPVFKEVGMECFGGTINLDGNINIKVTKQNKDGTLANIIKLVDQAQSSKAPIEHLADTVSGVFVPAIILIAIITFISWYFISGDISKAIITSVASLVIACPCALGLATPTAIMVGTGVGAKNGILIKNATTLEKTKDVDIVVFDKTGTLTNGKLELTDVITFGKLEQEVLIYASSLAYLSHHPLSKAIINFLPYLDSEEGLDRVEAKNFEEIKGKGLSGTIGTTKLYLGNKSLFKNIGEEVIRELDLLTSKGKTPVLVGDDKEIYGIIGLLDLAKTGVGDIIKQLHNMGMEVVMLTGDTKNTADFIANELNIDKVIAEVTPANKLEVIEKFQAEGKKVLFVGDGINDAPALTKADLSIAMGTGSDIAIESADIVLLKGSLDKVLSAINLSRQTLTIIKQNLFWAFIYNIALIPLAAFGILNPLFASLAMSMSSVSVVSNSLRLKFFKK